MQDQGQQGHQISSVTKGHSIRPSELAEHRLSLFLPQKVYELTLDLGKTSNPKGLVVEPFPF